jgi:hypothetical protein
VTFVFLTLAGFGRLALDLFARLPLGTALGRLLREPTFLDFTLACTLKRPDTRVTLVVRQLAEHHARARLVLAERLALVARRG